MTTCFLSSMVWYWPHLARTQASLGMRSMHVCDFICYIREIQSIVDLFSSSCPLYDYVYSVNAS